MGIRGVYRFSSLMKQNKKAKNYAVFCFAGFFCSKILCYEVIVKHFFLNAPLITTKEGIEKGPYYGRRKKNIYER
jgi:hypothetical protein